MSPGDELYSCAGHSCLRLECPTFGLDYCFSYESESAKGRMYSLLAGKLKMGMFAVPTEEYLKNFAQEGRRVEQYALNLPPDAEQRLWRELDDEVAQGANLQYDPLRHGCAQSIIRTLRKILPPYHLSDGALRGKYAKTRRELVEAAVGDKPWQKFFLHTFSGMELDRDVPNSAKIVTPVDLVEYLQTSKIRGMPVITGQGEELAKMRPGPARSVVTPMTVAAFVAGATAVNAYLRMAWLDYAFLGFQSLFGFFLAWLVFVSDLFGTGWNWLIVPFNPLPLVLWKWRWKWALWFTGILVAWEAGMISYPHRLTDPAFLVLVAAYVLMYARIGLGWNFAAQKKGGGV